MFSQIKKAVQPVACVGLFTSGDLQQKPGPNKIWPCSAKHAGDKAYTVHRPWCTGGSLNDAGLLIKQE